MGVRAIIAAAMADQYFLLLRKGQIRKLEPAVLPHEEIAPIAPRKARPSGGLLPDSDAPQDVFVSANTLPSCSRVPAVVMLANLLRRQHVKSPEGTKARVLPQERHQE